MYVYIVLSDTVRWTAKFKQAVQVKLQP